MSILNKIIEINNPDKDISISNNLFIVSKNGNKEALVPLNEISVVIISNYNTSISHRVVSELGKNNVSLIICDDKFLPSSIMLPVNANFRQAQRYVKQFEMSLPLKKNLWKNIVVSKINSQSDNLIKFQGSDFGLKNMSSRVKSGDSDNLESTAARIYWSKLFGNKNFKRDRASRDQNVLLNYGYMVIRSIVSRSVCAAGLHPTLGIHHKNQYDVFCLSEDLMEPFRFIVDDFVVNYIKDNTFEINKKYRYDFLKHIMGRFEYEDEKTSIFNISSKICDKIVRSIYSKNCELSPPRIKIT